MIEIRIHGRGGQGVVLLSELIAVSAFMDGKFSRSFPYFGFARRGSPVTAFVMICGEDEITRSQTYTPDVVLVLDRNLPKVLNVTEGLKKGGIVILNSPKDPFKVVEDFKIPHTLYKIATIDATSIAIETLKRPMTSTVMFGAFVRLLGIITKESAIRALKARLPPDMVEPNIIAFNKGYENVCVRG
jgi:pyruvate ferredoxin oxidoreductase gamma subunit